MRSESGRRVAIAAVLAALVVAGGGAMRTAAAPAEEPGTVVVCGTHWPPIFFGEAPAGGEPLGFGRELLERCVARAGFRAVFRDVPVLRMYAELESGRLDVNLFSFAEERTRIVDYGREVAFRGSYRPVVRSESAIEIRRLADLDPLLLGHLRGLRYSDEMRDYVEAREASGRLRVVDTNEDLLELLLGRRIDVFVNLDVTTRWMAREKGVEDRVRLLPFEVKTSDYRVVLSRATPRVADRTAFLAAVDACIAEGRRGGWLAELESRYAVR